MMLTKLLLPVLFSLCVEPFISGRPILSRPSCKWKSRTMFDISRLIIIGYSDTRILDATITNASPRLLATDLAGITVIAIH